MKIKEENVQLYKEIIERLPLNSIGQCTLFFPIEINNKKIESQGILLENLEKKGFNSLLEAGITLDSFSNDDGKTEKSVLLSYATTEYCYSFSIDELFRLFDRRSKLNKLSKRDKDCLSSVEVKLVPEKSIMISFPF